MKRTGPTSTRTRTLAVQLEKHGKTTEQNAYRIISEMIQTSTRIRAEVSVGHLAKLHDAYQDKVLVVPGKVLSQGQLDKPIEVAAMAFSASAKKKILAHKGKAWTLEELVHNKVPANKIILVK